MDRKLVLKVQALSKGAKRLCVSARVRATTAAATTTTPTTTPTPTTSTTTTTSTAADVNHGLKKKFSNSQFCLLKQHQMGKNPAGSHRKNYLIHLKNRFLIIFLKFYVG